MFQFHHYYQKIYYEIRLVPKLGGEKRYICPYVPCVGLLVNNNVIKVFIDLSWYLFHVRYLISYSRLMVQTAYDSAYIFERKYGHGK